MFSTKKKLETDNVYTLLKLILLITWGANTLMPVSMVQMGEKVLMRQIIQFWKQGT